MTDEQLAIVLQVIEKLAPSNTFSFYDVEDIRQEAFLLCDKIIQQWDGIRPLENFLMVSLGRRLKSFRRDNYYRHDAQNQEREKRKRAALDFIEEIDVVDNRIDNDEVYEVHVILDDLPPSLRSDFLRLANGVQLSATRKAAVYDKVKEINEKRKII